MPTLHFNAAVEQLVEATVTVNARGLNELLHTVVQQSNAHDEAIAELQRQRAEDKAAANDRIAALEAKLSAFAASDPEAVAKRVQALEDALAEAQARVAEQRGLHDTHASVVKQKLQQLTEQLEQQRVAEARAREQRCNATDDKLDELTRRVAEVAGSGVREAEAAKRKAEAEAVEGRLGGLEAAVAGVERFHALWGAAPADVLALVNSTGGVTAEEAPVCAAAATHGHGPATVIAAGRPEKGSDPSKEEKRMSSSDAPSQEGAATPEDEARAEGKPAGLKGTAVDQQRRTEYLAELPPMAHLLDHAALKARGDKRYSRTGAMNSGLVSPASPNTPALPDPRVDALRRDLDRVGRQLDGVAELGQRVASLEATAQGLAETKAEAEALGLKADHAAVRHLGHSVEDNRRDIDTLLARIESAESAATAAAAAAAAAATASGGQSTVTSPDASPEASALALAKRVSAAVGPGESRRSTDATSAIAAAAVTAAMEPLSKRVAALEQHASKLQREKADRAELAWLQERIDDLKARIGKGDAGAAPRGSTSQPPVLTPRAPATPLAAGQQGAGQQGEEGAAHRWSSAGAGLTPRRPDTADPATPPPRSGSVAGTAPVTGTGFSGAAPVPAGASRPGSRGGNSWHIGRSGAQVRDSGGCATPACISTGSPVYILSDDQ